MSQSSEGDKSNESSDDDGYTGAAAVKEGSSSSSGNDKSKSSSTASKKSSAKSKSTVRSNVSEGQESAGGGVALPDQATANALAMSTALLSVLALGCRKVTYVRNPCCPTPYQQSPCYMPMSPYCPYPCCPPPPGPPQPCGPSRRITIINPSPAMIKEMICGGQPVNVGPPVLPASVSESAESEREPSIRSNSKNSKGSKHSSEESKKSSEESKKSSEESKKSSEASKKSSEVSGSSSSGSSDPRKPLKLRPAGKRAGNVSLAKNAEGDEKITATVDNMQQGERKPSLSQISDIFNVKTPRLSLQAVTEKYGEGQVDGGDKVANYLDSVQKSPPNTQSSPSKASVDRAVKQDGGEIQENKFKT